MKMNKKTLIMDKTKNAKRICTKSVLFNDSKRKSKECHANKKMLKGYVPNHYYLMIVKQNQKNVTETTKEKLQEQARNSCRYCSGGEETKKQREYGRMEDIDIRIRLKETKQSKTIWTNLLWLKENVLIYRKKISVYSTKT